MSILKENLKNIYAETQEKLLPENIKAGVTILGVTGTYTGETTDTGNTDTSSSETTE